MDKQKSKAELMALLKEKVEGISFEYAKPAPPPEMWPVLVEEWGNRKMDSLYSDWIEGIKRRKEEIPKHDPEIRRLELFLDEIIFGPVFLWPAPPVSVEDRR